MQCQEAESFVSVLYDGEPAPPEAARHLADCLACRTRLKEYAELGAELRLLARTSEAGEAKPLPMPLPARQRSWWAGLWTGRVLVPRFAVGLALAAIVGLSVGLGFVQAEDRGPWFEFDLRFSDSRGTTGKGLLSAEGRGPTSFLLGRPEGAVGCMVEIVEIRSGGVRLAVRARRVIDQEVVPTVLESMAAREYWYIPGQTLAIRLEDGVELWLTGKLLTERPKESPWEGPLEPKADQIAITAPALARSKALLFDWAGGSASSQGEKAAIAVYQPGTGLFVWSLKPFEGAVRGESNRSRARFTLDGQEYLLFSVTPITGGEQPRSLWFYFDPTYQPSRMSGGFISGSSDVSQLLERLKH